MSKSFTTTDGTLYIPGAYAQYKVQSNPSGLATTGVLMLIGEADQGADMTLETDLELNAFGPDQMSDVLAKYGSGPLVDAFRAACSPADDPDITGSFSSAILVKTNVGAKASGLLGSYSTLTSALYGKAGNGTTYQSLLGTAQVIPTTGSFTWIPNVASLNYSIRVNGGAVVGTSIAANQTPTQVVATVGALTGIAASGGVNRGMVTVAGSIGMVASGNTAVLTRTVAWTVTPVVGDTLIIPTGSVLAGTSDVNVGAFVVTAATSMTVSATRLSAAGKTVGGAATPGTVPATMATVASTPIVAITDVMDFSPVVITLSANTVIDGIGQSLEIAELTTGTDLLSRCAYALNTSAVSWISKAASPKLLTSAAELQMSLLLSLPTASKSETLTAGGEIGLKLGYTGTTGTVTITATTLTTTVTGGTGANLSLTLADYANLTALCNYINTQTGYVASPGTTALGTLPLSALDLVTAQGICTSQGNAAGRVKTDAYRFAAEVNGSSGLVSMVKATVGLPVAAASQSLLSGGSKGATTDAAVVSALVLLESVRGNFVVPLFSRDASSDITDSLTDAASTYTIAGIHAAVKSHVLAMSTLKRRRHRQGFLSIVAPIATARETAANLASFRLSCTSQDQKLADSTGSIVTTLPWSGAVLAAAMQAAGFYRSIEYKGINTSGVLSRLGDFNVKNDSQVENALRSGLLIARQSRTGGYIWVSDQTTYGTDSNFVFNSIQAVYAADTVSQTMATRMEAAFIGQSVADVSAAVARSFAEAVLADMLRLKLIAPSDDGAPRGFKNLTVRIIGNAMKVACEIKLATAIDFITIDFLVSAVQQSA